MRHFAALHAVTPDRAAIPLRRAVLAMNCAGDGLRVIGEQLARIPHPQQPAAVREVVDRAWRSAWPEWPAPSIALCRSDPNTTNFIRRHDPHEAWASVDWENSGWGDPAFELADLTAHPAYLDVGDARWAWVVETYCALRADDAITPNSATGSTGGHSPIGSAGATFRVRVHTYRRLMLVWWVVRLARSLYEVPRGLDRRLATRPAGWYTSTLAALDRYLVSAHDALAKRRYR